MRKNTRHELNVKNRLQSPPIFVVGAPRSGTTLMAHIVGRHPEVASLGESHFFEDVWARRFEIGDLGEMKSLLRAVERALTLFGRYEFPDTQRLVEKIYKRESLISRTQIYGGGYDGLYYALLSGLAEYLEKPRFCDDTPKHVYYLDTLLDLFPEAKVIAFVRDPRDFLSSYKNYWKRMESEYESNRIKTLYHPILTSLLWYSSTKRILKFMSHPSVLVVQYEQLVRSPMWQVKRICDFLGLVYSDALVQVGAHNSSYEQNQSSGIYTSSIGRWQNRLYSHEIWWVQMINAMIMKRFDYPSQTVQPPFLMILLSFLTAPIALIRAIYANASRRGPVMTYIWQRLLALFS
jgi:omega-hydroxy-beta-dihydromenaquinone-9 sulfotransferase